jgi:sn-glycerol 3-phosphate transport system permease protein
VLILGVLVVAFPLYMTFVASPPKRRSHCAVAHAAAARGHLIENYTAAWNGTGGGSGSKRRWGR